MSSAVDTLWLRTIIRYFRSKSRIIESLATPLFFLLILGFGLNSVSTIPGTGHSFIIFLIPGIITMAVLFTSVFSGIQIIWDRHFGFLKETLIAPVSRNSIMIGQTLGGATTAIIEGMIILVLSLFIVGSFPSVLGFLIAISFMVLISISFSSLGIAIASRMEDMYGFQMIMNFLIMPIFFLSGALFPLTNAPTVLKAIAYVNPLTYGVEGIRYGFLGVVPAINPLISFAVLTGFCIIMVFLGGYLFNKVKV